MASGLLGDPAYAVGTPALSAFVSGGSVQRVATGSQLGSAAISLDFTTRGQYVYDSFGRKSGSADVAQLLTLALTTRLGTCVVSTLGERFNEISKMTEGFAQDMRGRFDEAVSGIVGRKILQVNSVTISERNGHPAVTHVQATDLTTLNPIELSL